MKENRNFKVRALGEIAIRCNDVAPMVAFYRDVIGLELMTEADAPIVFFKIAEGFGGHTSVLALFGKAAPVRPGLHPTGEDHVETGAKSSLHHIALSLPYAEQEAVMTWYEAIGQQYRVELFEWVGWRGVFTTDPEGNTVELVAYDAALKA
ncbi:VOC family protein [uncultured Litoreibacter sp.]|uniref:VOC family protein n=1 Tax=uncultured Litoreibacter sp. TaxID=1392394 RepID=UPI002635EF33|nr:VOC family protein [uncultured Litoreibacter sp.]